jgi:hypothetical protein
VLLLLGRRQPELARGREQVRVDTSVSASVITLLPLGLHIPDGFLSLEIALLAAVPAAVAVAYAVHVADRDLDDRRVPLVGVLAGHPLELAGVAGDTASLVHRLDPRAKIVATLAVVLVAVSTPPAGWPVYVACALVLATRPRLLVLDEPSASLDPRAGPRRSRASASGVSRSVPAALPRTRRLVGR